MRSCRAWCWSAVTSPPSCSAPGTRSAGEAALLRGGVQLLLLIAVMVAAGELEVPPLGMTGEAARFDPIVGLAPHEVMACGAGYFGMVALLAPWLSAGARREEEGARAGHTPSSG